MFDEFDTSKRYRIAAVFEELFEHRKSSNKNGFSDHIKIAIIRIGRDGKSHHPQFQPDHFTDSMEGAGDIFAPSETSEHGCRIYTRNSMEAKAVSGAEINQSFQA